MHVTGLVLQVLGPLGQSADSNQTAAAGQQTKPEEIIGAPAAL
jgi:hypothetical protein